MPEEYELGGILSSRGIIAATIGEECEIENICLASTRLIDFKPPMHNHPYTTKELEASYDRYRKVELGGLLTLEEFLAETGKELHTTAADTYEVLVKLVKECKLSPRDVYSYAKHHWCLNHPESIIGYRNRRNEWIVNNCENHISESDARIKICEEWGFEASRIRVFDAYYNKPHHQFIRFVCGHAAWLWHNTELSEIIC